MKKDKCYLPKIFKIENFVVNTFCTSFCCTQVNTRCNFASAQKKCKNLVNDKKVFLIPRKNYEHLFYV